MGDAREAASAIRAALLPWPRNQSQELECYEKRVYTCVCMCVHNCMRMYMYVCMHLCIAVCICVHVCI